MAHPYFQSDVSLQQQSNMANSMESVGSWTPKQVGLWLKGLDDAVQPYIQSFILAGVTGEQLLNLSHRDMDRLNITKLGHQELILEAVDLLCALNFGLENETLQSLTVALGLNVENLDMAMTVRNQQSILVGLAGPRDNYKLPPDILRAICDVLSAAKAVVSWLDRTPFVQMMNYIAIRNRIVRICLGFTSSIHKDPNKRDAEETVVPLCKELAMLSQSLQLSVKDDPQVCSAARVEVVTLTNVDHKLGLGMFIQSSFNGTHYVTGTKEGSPAYTCKRIHPGDEILQVNYQTVVGWKLKKLVDALKEDPHGVVITFKKRPKTSRSSGTPSRPSSGSSSRLSQNSRHSSGNHICGRSLDSASPANSVGRVPPSPLVELYLPPPPPEPYKPRQNFFDRVRTPTSNITQSQVQVHQPLWEDEDMSPPPPQPLSDRSQSVHIPTHRQDQQATWDDDERSPPSSRPLSGRSQSVHFPSHGQRTYWDGDEERFSPTDAPPFSSRAQSFNQPRGQQWDGDEEHVSPTDAPPFSSRAQSFNQPRGQQWELTQRDFSQPQPPVTMAEQSMYSSPPQNQWIPFPENVSHDVETPAQASRYESIDVQHREDVVQRSPVSFPKPARSHSLHVPIYGPQWESEGEVPPEEPVPAYMPRGGHRRSKREDSRPLVSDERSGRDSRRSSQRHSRRSRPTNMQMRSFSPQREDSEEEGASIDSVSTVVTRSPVSPASPQWEEGEGLSPTRPLPLGARSPNYLLDRQSKYRRSATFSEGTENHDPSFRLAQETRETLREAMLRARQNRKDRPRERPKSLPPDTGMQGFRAGGEREERREVSNQRLSDHVRMEVETISEASTSAESSPQRSVPPRPLSQPDSAPRPLSADREVIVIDKQNAIKDFVPSNLRKLTGDMSSMPAFRVERETRPRGKNASRGPPPPYERSRMDGRHSFKSVPEVSKLPMDEVARRTRPLTEQFSAKLAIFEGGSESNVMKRPQRKHFAERVSELQEAVKSPAKDESKEEEEESNFQRGVVGKAETDDSTIRTTRYVHRISLRFKKDKDKSESAGANPEGASPQAADSEPANVLPVSVQPSKQSFRKESPEVANLDDIQSRFAPSPIVPPPNQERLVREKTKQFTRRMDPVESARIVEQEPSYSGSPNKEVKYDTPPFPDQRDSVREARTNPTVQKQEVLPKSPTSAPGSYSVKIVGGVPVRIGSTSHVQQNMNTAKNPFCSCLSPSYSRVSFQMPPPDQSSVRLRSKNKVTGTQKYSRRRMSCKDLGNGDCEGWLWKKKDQRKIFGQKWKKLWFVLKKFSLYYYAGQDALKAEGIINLPEYSVVYATDTECGRKFGIKASHMEIKTFFFATDSKEDRDRWLNKLQLASIQYDRQSIHDPELNILELAKQCPAIVEGFGYYSESDEESEPPSPNPVSPTRQSPSPPRKRKESSPERPVFDDTPVVSPVATAPVGNSMKRSREKPRKPSYLAAFDMNGTKKSPPSERKSPSNPPRPPYDPPRPPHDPPRPPSNPPVEQWGQLSTTSSDSECTHVTPISSTSSSSSTASSPMLLLPPPPQFGSTDELKNLYRQSWNVLQEEKMMKMLELGQGNLSEKQEKKLKLQKLTRVLKDKEGNLEAIDRLLKSPQLTSREVQDWKDQNQHILEDVEKHKDGADPPQRPPSTSSRHNSQSGPVPKPRTSIHRNSQGPIEEMTQRLSITKRPLSTDLDRIESDAGIKPPLPEIDDDEDDSYSSTSL
ncbi:uncharacterized protein LOC144886089 isoform X10 [Branchiostoma floridae x Branchiostoma japonicum]